MRRTKALCILVLATSLSLVAMLAIPARPALAESIRLSPTAGVRGTKVVVTGTTFTVYRNKNVQLYFDYEWIKSVGVSDSGNFSTSFYIPSYYAPGKHHTVRIRNSLGRELVKAEFFVAPELRLKPNEGKIGDWIDIEGYGFNTTRMVGMYFSSDTAFIGANIDDEVTAYEVIGTLFPNDDRKFGVSYRIPDRLVDGEDKEDVHGGDYYFYASYYFTGKSVSTATKFTVIGGKIRLDPTVGRAGTLVEVNGEGFRNNQVITIRYDGQVVPIVTGNRTTSGDGKFSCLILVPKSTVGNHTITAVDKSGNSPEAAFTVEPGIIVTPPSTPTDTTVKVSGASFAAASSVTITFDGYAVHTTTAPVKTDAKGSFDSSFVIPSPFSHTKDGVHRIAAYDENFNIAEAQLIILATPPALRTRPTWPAMPGARLHPTTNQTSPGHVGMEVTASGTRFTPNATVSIDYSNGEAITVAKTMTDASGDFSATFTIPPGISGNHTVTCTDGINSATSGFVMESEAPPVPSLSELVTHADGKLYFDWESVTDPSGVTYTFQIAADIGFTTIVVEEPGLTNSEHSIIKDETLKRTRKETSYLTRWGEEKVRSTKREISYYWRVKAVDGASNESAWTQPGVFRVIYYDTPQASKGDSVAKSVDVGGVGGWDIGRMGLSIGTGAGLVGLLFLITLWFRRRRSTAGELVNPTR